MQRTFALALIPLLTALVSACGAAQSQSTEPTRSTEPHACPEGFVWNGTKCEDRRSIVIEQGAPKPPPPPPPNGTSATTPSP